MAKPKAKSIVQPSVKFAGDSKEHAIEALFNGDPASLPLVKSVGYMKVPNTNQYVSFVMTSRGTEVVNLEVEEPNLRAIAEESAKIAFVNSFMEQE